jgi:hypothetical protein
MVDLELVYGFLECSEVVCDEGLCGQVGELDSGNVTATIEML